MKDKIKFAQEHFGPDERMDIVTSMSSKYSSHSEINTEQRFSDSLRIKGKADIECFLIKSFYNFYTDLILIMSSRGDATRARDQSGGRACRQLSYKLSAVIQAVTAVRPCRQRGQSARELLVSLVSRVNI